MQPQDLLQVVSALVILAGIVAIVAAVVSALVVLVWTERMRRRYRRALDRVVTIAREVKALRLANRNVLSAYKTLRRKQKGWGNSRALTHLMGERQRGPELPDTMPDRPLPIPRPPPLPQFPPEEE